MSQRELFETVIVNHRAPEDPQIPQLIEWAATFAALGFTPSYGPGDHGNLSCRTPQGLLITARATTKANLSVEHFVEVLTVDEQASPPQADCRGLRLPSTDTLLHWRVYRVRTDVQAILHGHDPMTLKQAEALRLPVTTHSAATPSRALIDEACHLAQNHDYIILRDHGFLALGRSIREAGALVRQWSLRATSMMPVAP